MLLLLVNDTCHVHMYVLSTTHCCYNVDKFRGVSVSFDQLVVSILGGTDTHVKCDRLNMHLYSSTWCVVLTSSTLECLHNCWIASSGHSLNVGQCLG